jgi:hypothetical protein
MSTPPGPLRPLPGTPAESTDRGARVAEITRTLLALTVVFGQLWALTVSLEEYLSGHTARAWWLAGFSAVSFVVVLILVRLLPPARSRRRTARR